MAALLSSRGLARAQLQKRSMKIHPLITDSAELGKQVLEGYGVDVQLVPYPIMATDISSAPTAMWPAAISTISPQRGRRGAL
mgnify:CR=1 FL=1